MKKENEIFITQFRQSPHGEQFIAKAESARLARRRDALRGWEAFTKTNARFMEKLAAAEAKIAARHEAYQAAEAAFIKAGAEVYRVTRDLDNLRSEEQRAECTARGAVHRESNPRRQELLFEPLRRAIEAAERARPMTKTETIDAGKNKARVGGAFFLETLDRGSYLVHSIRHASTGRVYVSGR